MLTQAQGGLQVTFGNCELNIGDPKARTTSEKSHATADAKAEAKKDTLVDTVSNLIK
jgi:hypothetical protein